MTNTLRTWCHRLSRTALTVLLLQAVSSQADLLIVNNDGPDEGLNDSSPATAIGGNSGTTIGEQRLNVFQRAAAILNASVSISQAIEVDAQFNPLTCDATSAVLGSAGPTYMYTASESGVNTVYPISLANEHFATDLVPDHQEIQARFNSGIGTTGCLESSGWYYGYDDPAGSGSTSLLAVVLHELMHGMGFLSMMAEDGSAPDSIDGADAFDPYSKLLYDNSQSSLLPDLSRTQRAAAALNDGNLLWDGAQTNARLNGLTQGVNGSRVQMYAPAVYESGSSVSHFDTALTPNEIMEPVYTEFLDHAGLARFVLADIGWMLSNTPPVMTAISDQSMDEDSTLSLTLNASDADADSLTYNLTTAAAVLGASLSGNTLSFTPQADYYGSSTVTVQVSDGTDSDSSSFTLTVNAVNDAPQLTTTDSYTIAASDTLTITLSAEDIDSAVLTYTLDSFDAAAVSASLSGDVLTITPVSGVSGTTQLTVSVSDGALSASQTLSVTVLSASNQAPLWDSLPALNILAGSSASVALSASDPDGDALSYSITATDSSLTALISGSTLIVSAADSASGSATVGLQVSDGVLSSDSTLTVNIYPAFDLGDGSSELAGGATLAISDSAFSFTLSGGNNILTTTLFYNGSDHSDWLSYDSASGGYTLAMPDSGAFAGTYSLTVTDENGLTATWYLERPMRISSNVSPLLITASSQQQLLLAGAPAGTTISLSSSLSALNFSDGSGNLLTAVSAADDAISFNATPVWLVPDSTQTSAFTTQVSVSAVNIPETATDLTFSLPRSLLMRVEDVQGSPVTPATVTTDDERFDLWGLPAEQTTDSNGQATLSLPPTALTLQVSAADYQSASAAVDDSQTSITIVLSKSSDAFLLNGIIQADGFTFSSELPLITLYFTDGSSELLPATSINSSAVRYQWSGDLSVARPDYLTISHSQSSLYRSAIDSSSPLLTLNVTLSVAEATPDTATVTLPSSSSGGAFWYFWLIAAVFIVLIKRSAEKRRRPPEAQ